MDLGCHGIAFCYWFPRSSLRTPNSKKHSIRANTWKLSSVFSILAALLLPALLSGGDTEYYRHIVFDNSLTSDNYFYSYAQASSPSLIEQKDGAYRRHYPRRYFDLRCARTPCQIA
jgi:hypothetical protein